MDAIDINLERIKNALYKQRKKNEYQNKLKVVRSEIENDTTLTGNFLENLRPVNPSNDSLWNTVKKAFNQKLFKF